MMRRSERVICDIIIQQDVQSIAACAIGRRNYEVLANLANFDILANIYDYDPTIKIPYNCVDFIIDDITLEGDLIVHFNVENTYPIGKVHKGRMLLVYDDLYHNGNCTEYKQDIHNSIAKDNNITIEDKWTVVDKHKTFYIVLGTSND